MTPQTNLPVMTPELQRSIEETAARQHTEDIVAKDALAEPFPGATKEAFAREQDVEAAGYKVRPLYLVDFEFLTEIDNAFASLRNVVNEGGSPSKELTEANVLFGHTGWELCWILTRPVDDVEETLEKGGPKAVRKAARREFGRKQAADVSAVIVACYQQIDRFWSTAVSHEASKTTEEKKQEGASRPLPPS